MFDALALHTTRFNALREEVEFQNTQERSKSDLRYDRSTAQDSGYQVPPPVQTTEDSLSESTARLSMNPYAAYLKPSSPPASPPPASNNPYSHLAATTAPESNYNFDFVDSGNSQFQTNSYSVSGQYDNSDHIDQPVERSEKSKGKGRSASYSLKE